LKGLKHATFAGCARLALFWPASTHFEAVARPTRWTWTKLHDTALALTCLSLAWFAITWNLMNFNLHY
jgi:hypothetical protein